MKNNLKFVSLLLVGLWMPSWSLWADGTLTPAHGGRMAEANGSRLELVVAADKIDLYVTDHGDKPVAVHGASAKVTFLVGGKKEEVALVAVSDNLLSGQKAVAGGDKAAAVVTVQGLPKPISARLPAQK
ncbi:MAG: hypothetical protein HQL07_04875 [Nitrospirae bacterium]|nr:hypothetical protein [Magnetococcales bacterium]HAT49123.1 hypothetical protein [Alphaproteobacteria bacterium]